MSTSAAPIRITSLAMEHQQVDKAPAASKPNKICYQLLWLIFGGGLISAILWCLLASIASILFIPFPVSRNLFKLISVLISPSTKYIDYIPERYNLSFSSKVSRFFWILPFGLILCIFHCAMGIIYAPFIPFCNWSFYHWKLMIHVFYPRNKHIIDTDKILFNTYTNSHQIMQHTDLSAKLAIVTGCNAGIGRQIAQELYAKGCIVIMACRNEKKANAARNDIIQEIGDENEENLIFIRLDLADLKTIDEFVTIFSENKIINHKLDYLINNAGGPQSMGKTNDGFYNNFGVNYMGHFYLTNKLLPFIKANKGRIINAVSSAMYMFVHAQDINIWLNDTASTLKGPTPDVIAWSKGGFKYYAISKLCVLLFTRYLNQLYRADGVIALCADPGFVPQTPGAQSIEYDWEKIRAFMNITSLLLPLKHMKTITEGAATALRCVTVTEDEIIRDEALFFDDCMPRNDKIPFEFRNGGNTDMDQTLWEYSLQTIQSLDYLQSI